MKTFFKIVIVAFVATLSVSCINNPQTNYGGGGGGQRVVTQASPRKVSDAIFGHQPKYLSGPYKDTVWGATMGSPGETNQWWANDQKNGFAAIQPVSANEPVKITPQGYVYRPGCGNRVIRVDPPTEAVVENTTSQGGGYNESHNELKIGILENLRINVYNSGERYRGGYSSGGYYSQREYYSQRSYSGGGRSYQPQRRQESNDCPPGYYRPTGR